MDTFLEIIQAVQSDLTIGDESSLLPLDTVKAAINRAYKRSASLFKWPMIEEAKKTSTVANQEYYDFPTTWRPDSAWRLEVDGDQYGEDPDGSPMSFEDYLTWKADPDNANSTEKKWAVQHTRYFIYPTPTSNGSNNISIWGYKAVTSLSANGDTTIFSYSMPECNEAIALEAKAILSKKGNDKDSGIMASQEAKEMLLVAWNKIRQEQAKFEKTQPMFEVPDFFSNTRQNAKNRIGNF